MRDDDAPWLAEAAPLNEPRSAAQRRPALNIAIAVLALGAIAAVGLLMLLGSKDGGSGQGYMEASQAPLIEADAGPYRTAPADREGLELEGDGDVIYEAMRGEDVQSQIDLNAVPEEPIGRPRDLLPPDAGAPPPPPPGSQPVTTQVVPAEPAVLQPNVAQAGIAQSNITGPAALPKPVARSPVAAVPLPAKPAPAPAPAIAKPAPAIAKPVGLPLGPVATAARVQIGAFSSEAKADEEWARVSGKAKLTGKQVQKLTNAAGRTLWRVRGQTSDADAACKAILAAKGACEVVKAKS